MECKTLTQEQMQQTIDQLRANAKGHKKTVDKLSAEVSQLTQQLEESSKERMFLVGQLNEATAVIMRGGGGSNSVEPEKKTKWSIICYLATGIVLCGFLFALGAFCACGWLLMLKDLL